MDGFPPLFSSFSHQEFQEMPHPQEYVDAPDIWQAPINFEWDQWAAFVARSAGEAVGFEP
jgi:hypothetical protein